MKCRKCKTEMLKCLDQGLPGYYCSVCGGVAGVENVAPVRPCSVPVAGIFPTEPGEVRFEDIWGKWGRGIELEPEYQFNPFRRWSLDYAHVVSRIAIEIEGPDHQKSNRYGRDIEKYNALAHADWLLFRITPAMIKSEAQASTFCRIVCEAIEKRT